MHGGRRHPKSLRHIIDREVIAAIVNPDFGMKAIKLGKKHFRQSMMRYPFSLVLLQFGSVILGLLRFLKVLVLANMFWKCASSSSYTRDDEP